MLMSPALPSPPTGYGGTERVVENLAHGLARRGHEITVFGRVTQPLSHSATQPLSHSATQPLSHSATQPLSRVDVSSRRGSSSGWTADHIHAAKALRLITDRSEFDLVHNHSAAALPLLDWVKLPHVTTVHGDTRRSPADLLYTEYAAHPFVAESESQRVRGLPHLNWQGTIPPGIDQSAYSPGPTTIDTPARIARPGFLLHMGSLGSRKGTLEAIWIAKAVERPLVVIGRPDPQDVGYYETEIAPYLNDPQVTFLGERGDVEKIGYLRDAAALVHPLAWEEPFGLVMLEALACGTPVLALDRGAVRELVRHGRTGFIGTTWPELIGPARNPEIYDPQACRESVDHLTVENMVDQYIKIYERFAG
jgi:glycosyltransferase involved in cell wall biosynthesis